MAVPENQAGEVDEVHVIGEVQSLNLEADGFIRNLHYQPPG